LPLIIELEDAAEAGPAGLGDIEQRQQRFFQRHSHVTIPRLTMKRV
jgi:hypothetical protein